jgi:hypothetical protein
MLISYAYGYKASNIKRKKANLREQKAEIINKLVHQMTEAFFNANGTTETAIIYQPITKNIP